MIPGVCYNPLHNDLDPYAVAYAIASLLNNLFGKSKEPFWQQAYTDLLKFVISLRRITDGYTTLAEVYRYIIEDGQIDKNIRTLKAQFDNPPDVLAIDRERYQGDVRQAPWTLWAPLDETHVGHPYDAELESYLAEHRHPVRGPDRRRGDLRRSSTPSRSDSALVQSHVEEARSEGQGVDRRRHRRVPLALR